jgi:hypothetical protein
MVRLREPKPVSPQLVQGWCRFRHARTTHWMRFDGASLCGRWSRDDVTGEPQPDPVPGCRACETCREMLEAARAATRRQLNRACSRELQAMSQGRD